MSNNSTLKVTIYIGLTKKCMWNIGKVGLKHKIPMAESQGVLCVLSAND